MRITLVRLTKVVRIPLTIISAGFASLSLAAPEWLTVTGGGDEGVRIADGKVVSIPAGRSAILVVAVTSDEYPDWTGPSSEFNDLLEWDIGLSSGGGFNGSVDVNNRHSEWVEAEGVELQGFGPVHIERMVGVTAPDDVPLEVSLEAAATNIGDGLLPSTVMLGVLPIKPLELHPVLLDGSDSIIPDSQMPRTGGMSLRSLEPVAADRAEVLHLLVGEQVSD